MTCRVKMLSDKLGHNKNQRWVSENVQYEVITGSFAYGMDSDISDVDVAAITIPPKRILFPYDKMVYGFDTDFEKFEVYQKHHIQHDDSEYDVQVFNIVKFFNLAIGANPNILDILYVPERCVTQCGPIGQHIRRNRQLFLSKKVHWSFMGYAHAQMRKIRTRKDLESDAMRGLSSKRLDKIMEHGYDTKYASHAVRLVNQCRQLMTEGTMDLEQSRHVLKDIRAGNWELEDIRQYVRDSEKQLNALYNENCDVLPYKPDREKVRGLLNDCLAMWFGDSYNDTCSQRSGLLDDIAEVLKNHGVSV